MRFRPPKNSAGGFTLLEVLVAVAILAIGLGAVFGQLSQTVSTANYLRNTTLASWVAFDRITELRLTGKFPDITESDGEIAQAGQMWLYQINVSETAVPDLRRIDVSVGLADSPDNIIGKAVGFVGKPGTGEPIMSLVPGVTEGALE